MIDLLDVLKEADHLSSFTRKLISVASREITDADTARRRKLLVSFGLGSNIGIKRIADAIEPDDTEAALRRFRRIYFTRENLRAAIIEIGLYGPGLQSDRSWPAIAPVISARAIDRLIAQYATGARSSRKSSAPPPN